MRFYLIRQMIVFLLLFCSSVTAYGMQPLETETLDESSHDPSVSSEDDDHSAHGDGDAHRFFAGVKASYLMAIPHGSVHHFGGGGAFFEVLAIPRWLEIELFARVMLTNHLITLPIDLVFKIPFHINEKVHPFIGLGGTVVPVMADGETEVFFGGLLAVGSYFWINRSFGIVAELNYNLVYEHGVVNEIGANAGLVFGW